MPFGLAEHWSVHRTRQQSCAVNISRKDLKRDSVNNYVEIARLVSKVAEIEIEHVRSRHQRQSREPARDGADRQRRAREALTGPAIADSKDWRAMGRLDCNGQNRTDGVR